MARDGATKSPVVRSPAGLDAAHVDHQRGRHAVSSARDVARAPEADPSRVDLSNFSATDEDDEWPDTLSQIEAYEPRNTAPLVPKLTQ